VKERKDTRNERKTFFEDEIELRRCTTCNELDVLTPAMKGDERMKASSLHSSSIWVTPCLCPTYSHRSCLEKIRDTQEQESCPRCHCPFKFSQRLPIDGSELLKVTLEDHGWLFQRFFCVTLPLYICFIFISQFIENFECIFDFFLSTFFPSTFKYQFTGSWRYPSPPVLIWLSWHQFLFCILFSGRFREASTRLWGTPIFTFYMQLYFYYITSVIFFFLTFIRLPYHSSLPSIFIFASNLQQNYFFLHPLWQFLGYLNFISYLFVSSVVIYFFLENSLSLSYSYSCRSKF